MTARWTKETLALVMEALYEADGMPNQDKATDVLAALADAGVLVEPQPERCRCGHALPDPAHCDHCHDDPPKGHVCPRCGVARMAVPDGH